MLRALSILIVYILLAPSCNTTLISFLDIQPYVFQTDVKYSICKRMP